jgi:uncharacterized lipoprotein YmbA
MKTTHVRIFILFIYMVFIMLVGCAPIITPKPSRFYVLSPMTDTGKEKQVASEETRNISIGVGPVFLPKYLRKSQIVTRTGNNELHLAEFDRWAGKFEEDIGRVIAENLTNLLSTDKVLTYPAIGAIETDYRIEMGISMFEGRLGESAELIARWAIFDIQGKNVKSITSTRIIEPVQGTGYAGMIAAQSRILASLSRELADAIIELSAK